MTTKLTAGLLDSARAQIDRIDDSLLALLRERAAIVAEVAEAKRRAGEETRSAFRPEREAAILRRLHARLREQGNGPAFDGVARVWREIMSAALHQQEPVRVGVPAASGLRATALRGLARQHFGSGAAIQSFPNLRELYRATHKERSLVGLAAVPAGFAVCSVGRSTGPTIFAALPFWGAERPRAYAFGHVRLVPTGDDLTLVTMRRRAAVSVHNVVKILAEAGIDARYEGGQHGNSVFAVEGFRVGDAAAGLEAALRPLVRSWCILGAYARPIGVEADS